MVGPYFLLRFFHYIDCISAAVTVNRDHHTRAQSLTKLCLPRHRTVSIVRFQGLFSSMERKWEEEKLQKPMNKFRLIFV
jgi:hypothetical protein